jgi:hypothetical protein
MIRAVLVEITRSKSRSRFDFAGHGNGLTESSLAGSSRQ